MEDNIDKLWLKGLLRVTKMIIDLIFYRNIMLPCTRSVIFVRIIFSDDRFHRMEAQLSNDWKYRSGRLAF